MNITLYRTNSEMNVLNKNLEGSLSIEGHLQDSCNILSPIIRLQFNNLILQKNYCFIPSFNRYYYIQEIIIDNEELVLTLHVDVLKTYQNEIRNSTARVLRSVSNQNRFIIDDMISTTAEVVSYTRKIGSGFSPDDKYLLTLGG